MSISFIPRIGISLMERGCLPEWLVRWGIRRISERQLRRRSAEAAAVGGSNKMVQQFAGELRQHTVAPVSHLPNEQHYEVPAAFFREVLGSHLKYSCCYWDESVAELVTAEQRMLDLTLERSQLVDGMEVLELGCGWGAVTLAMAERYPRSHITAVSNSRLQKETIDTRARERGLDNISVITADMNDFNSESQFDRVVSVEMFEHMHNYQILLSRIAGWLKPEGKLFVHIFTHRSYPYFYEDEGAENWMGIYFFSGGIMPSEDLLLQFQDDLNLEEQWRISGIHYKKTADAWAENMNRHRNRIMPILLKHYGSSEANRWYMRWKIFFWACAETFGYKNGTEWGVSHYRFSKKSLNPS